MTQTPFGQTLYLWRLERGLTQEQLARQARIPRPNLSAIERGKREVQLSTLRSLAVALEVQPGILADGLSPAALNVQPRFSREALERIAEAAVKGAPVANSHERVLADLLRRIVRQRAQGAQKRPRALRGGTRAMEAAWLRLRSLCPPEVLRSLIQRVSDREVVE